MDGTRLNGETITVIFAIPDEAEKWDVWVSK